MSVYHTPVLLAETLDALNLAPGKTILDATLGGGGHTRAIAEKIAPGGLVIGLDQDDEALAEAKSSLADWAGTILFVKSNFADLKSALAGVQRPRVDGVLMDLGVSSHQLDTAGRGFAIRLNGPLDMRMNTGAGETAAEILNRLPEEEIARILFEYGEESRGRKIASEIVRRRARKPLETTEDLVDAVRGAMPMRTRPGEIHPATKTFQGIRIFVNRELDVLEQALDAAVEGLNPGGRLVVMSYHSLEDRIVKNRFNVYAGKVEGNDLPVVQAAARPRMAILTKKPIVPTEEETRRNPRARSAKLRVAERLEDEIGN